MLRKLLTLLAICAGLAAVGEPARAAVSTVEAVRLVQGAGVACSSSVAARQTSSAPGLSHVEYKAKPCPKPTIVVIVPTVMLQADRARE